MPPRSRRDRSLLLLSRGAALFLCCAHLAYKAITLSDTEDSSEPVAELNPTLSVVKCLKTNLVSSGLRILALAPAETDLQLFLPHVIPELPVIRPASWTGAAFVGLCCAGT